MPYKVNLLLSSLLQTSSTPFRGLWVFLSEFCRAVSLSLRAVPNLVFHPLHSRADCLLVSRLLGLKLFGNEFVAYSELMSQIKAGYAITTRGRISE